MAAVTIGGIGFTDPQFLSVGKRNREVVLAKIEACRAVLKEAGIKEEGANRLCPGSAWKQGIVLEKDRKLTKHKLMDKKKNSIGAAMVSAQVELVRPTGSESTSTKRKRASQSGKSKEQEEEEEEEQEQEKQEAADVLMQDADGSTLMKGWEAIKGAMDRLVVSTDAQIQQHKQQNQDLQVRITELEAELEAEREAQLGTAAAAAAASGLQQLGAPTGVQGGNCKVCAYQERQMEELKQALKGKEAELQEAVVQVALLKYQLQTTQSAPTAAAAAGIPAAAAGLPVIPAVLPGGNMGAGGGGGAGGLVPVSGSAV